MRSKIRCDEKFYKILKFWRHLNNGLVVLNRGIRSSLGGFHWSSSSSLLNDSPIWHGSRRLRLQHCSATVARSWVSHPNPALQLSWAVPHVSERDEEERVKPLHWTVLLQCFLQWSRSRLETSQTGLNQAVQLQWIVPCVSETGGKEGMELLRWTVSLQYFLQWSRSRLEPSQTELVFFIWFSLLYPFFHYLD